MIEDFLHRPWVIAALRASVLGPDLDALTDELRHLGYSVASIQNHLHAAGHLAYWMKRKRVQLRALDEALIRRFVQEHLPHCRCPVPRGTAPDFGGVAPHLLKLLRGRGRIVPPPASASTPFDAILDQFAKHLREHRGVSPATCERNVRDVRLILEQTYRDGAFDVSRLTPSALRTFVAERAARYSPRPVMQSSA